MLEVEHLTLGYGATDVVQRATLGLARGEIGCLLGPSGCGKTTLLRAIAGFEAPRGGRILLDGRVVASAGHQLPARERGVGMVFQEHALFPHLDVEGNVAFGLRGLAAAERRARVAQMLALVGLDGMCRRWPHELSGGQQQRVAIARALAPRPALLLLDEPFSSLDTGLRESIARELRSILRQAGATALMVTHDQPEAFAMADRIGVMAGGRLCQWADALELYRRPATPEVAALVGCGVLLPARRVADGWSTALGLFDGGTPAFEDGDGTRVLLRPQALRLVREGGVPATVAERSFRGSHFAYELALADATRVLVHGDTAHVHDIGAVVGLAPAS
ncbi:ABC transporter ATP-binding protein [Rubrivivax gelatinosus]|uniref:Iron(III) transport system ATP-binding protein n=1 Tax=Rubrivivax gelatinosus TaxID=28068 RepID=A0A4R2M970_RUBGE|nr:ABC transporter ATP-binding protein [Rubrivivax gelatinosus]MBK1689727.1 ABC transporter ATP-binding protein [Rubrivivax gelatinosus]TCP01525.1 iron(III) transport system ATP-binding protein [Rubrivivax gelatinosus]